MTNPVGTSRPEKGAARLPTDAARADGAWDIEVIGLWKSFGGAPVLRGLNLRVPPGERLVIVGPNGSGKTTFVKILATLLRPSAGRVWVAGSDVRTEANEVRRHIGVLCHQTFLYGELTARENLIFYVRMYSVPDPKGRTSELLRLVGLEGQADAPTRALSRGMQQRLALARALIHEPPILLLDEPDTGLDQRWADALRQLIVRRAAQGYTTLLTTHNLERSLDLADRVAVLNRGKIVLAVRRDELDVASLEEAYHRHTSARG